MNLDTIREALENATMTSQAHDILETVVDTLESDGYEVDEGDIENAIVNEINEVYSYDIEESLQYLLDTSCDYFGDLIDMDMKSATEFTCYNLNEEIISVLRQQEEDSEEKEQEIETEDEDEDMEIEELVVEITAGNF